MNTFWTYRTYPMLFWFITPRKKHSDKLRSWQDLSSALVLNKLKKQFQEFRSSSTYLCIRSKLIFCLNYPLVIFTLWLVHFYNYFIDLEYQIITNTKNIFKIKGKCSYKNEGKYQLQSERVWRIFNFADILSIIRCSSPLPFTYSLCAIFFTL